MEDLNKAKEVMKEKLLGTEVAADVQLSALSKETFDKNARKDEESGELFMGQDEFINAIAPGGEDYVSQRVCTVAQPQLEPLTDEAF
jgi:solute carrier family 25 aspartate/glutamate transporter 12/13